jgi:tetraacyldisaccharide 4'-kinase
MRVLSDTLRDDVWNRRSLGGRLAWLALQPASAVFGTVVALRNRAYAAGALRTERAAIGVVSVGNLCVGGTGKTPLTLWLARSLVAGGASVGILLRGHAGRARRPMVVSRGRGVEAEVEDAGDEAVMLSKCFGGVVIVAPRRVEGAALAAELGCDVIVLDDGFQHRSLARDFDLVLVDGRRGSLLPAGPMREPWHALARADAVAVVDKSGDGNAQPARPLPVNLPAFRVRFVPTALVESDAGRWQETPVAELSGSRVVLVSGIAQPQPFYSAVRQWEAEIAEIFEYPDHHAYTNDDWQRMARAARDARHIVTTEKDLVKLERFPFAREKLVALRIAPEVEDGERLIRQIRERLQSRAA